MTQQFLTKYCKNCALYSSKMLKCQLTGLEIQQGDIACARYVTQLDECGICGSKMPRGSLIDITNPADSFYVCLQCEQKIGTCFTCEKAQQCSFESDPSTLTKVIPQTIRQGNAVIQTQIRNPERVKITCEKNCACYDKEIGCIREESQCCNKYIFTRRK